MAYDPRPAVIYSYDKLVVAFMRANKWSYDEAVDWIDYNVIRGLAYCDNAPIIVYGSPDE